MAAELEEVVEDADIAAAEHFVEYGNDERLARRTRIDDLARLGVVVLGGG
jgi:hypothetical protein